MGNLCSVLNCVKAFDTFHEPQEQVKSFEHVVEGASLQMDPLYGLN